MTFDKLTGQCPRHTVKMSYLYTELLFALSLNKVDVAPPSVECADLSDRAAE